MDTTVSILQKVRYSDQESEPFEFNVKRDDLIDPVISGNKWRKLKYNIAQAEHKNAKGIITFGGAFSNHLVATAKACAEHDLLSIGIVRGEELNETSNETLKKCAFYGMELRFVSRSDYKKRNDYTFIKNLQYEEPDYFMVPEGGANFYGVIGCQDILKETQNHYDHIYVSAGTGTTAAGIALSMHPESKLHIVSALKGDFLKDETAKLINLVFNDEEATAMLMQRVSFTSDTYFGGYGKWDRSLINLIQSFYGETGLKLEPIYTGKVLNKMLADRKDNLISEEDKVLLVHTGGLQGVSGIERKLGYQLF